MPVRQLPNGKWKVDNTNTEHDTKEQAVAQMKAIYASKAKKKK